MAGAAGHGNTATNLSNRLDWSPQPASVPKGHEQPRNQHTGRHNDCDANIFPTTPTVARRSAARLPFFVPAGPHGRHPRLTESPVKRSPADLPCTPPAWDQTTLGQPARCSRRQLLIRLLQFGCVWHPGATNVHSTRPPSRRVRAPPRIVDSPGGGPPACSRWTGTRGFPFPLVGTWPVEATNLLAGMDGGLQRGPLAAIVWACCVFAGGGFGGHVFYWAYVSARARLCSALTTAQHWRLALAGGGRLLHGVRGAGCEARSA